MTNPTGDRASAGTGVDSNVAGDPARRRFLGRLIGLIASVIALGWAVPLAIFSVVPALRRRAGEWIEVGAVSDLDVDQPRELDMVVTRRDGWREVRAVKSFWAYRTATGDIVAFSSICPHLGCAFNWHADEQRFLCPCHRSVFSQTGRVLSGPSPRPLDRLDVRVESGRWSVFPQDFKIGVSQKIPV